MGKGDSGEMGQLITNQNEARMQPAQDLNVQRTGTMYNNMNQNYGQGVGMNMPDYSAVMNSYRQFLGGGMPTGAASGGYATNPYGDYNPYPTSLPSSNAGQQSFINQASRNNLGNNGLPIGNNGPGQATPAPPGTPRQPPMQSQPQGIAGSQGASQPQGGGNIASDFNEAVKGLPSAATMNDNKDHSGINQLASNLTAQGHQVEPGLTDEFGRMDSLKIDGQIYRVNDSSGNWNLKSNANGDAWGGTYYGNGDPRNASDSGGQGQGAIGGFQNFAQTGGFSPQDIQDIRARAIAPTRAIYQNAQNDLQTQMARTGGYMPNYAAAQADLARKANYGISDANTNADASIAQMVQQGKLYGLTGMSNAQLGAMAGMQGLYGTTPGLANTFGNQVLSANNQNLGNQTNQLQLSNDLFNAKNQQSQIPSTYQQALGNVGGTMKVAGQAAMMFA